MALDVGVEAAKSDAPSLSNDIKIKLGKYENLDNVDMLPTMWMGSQND